ncbi:MAG: hypothetical protein AB7P76_00785 [Candidatus Melainabacteria bacterium]
MSGIAFSKVTSCAWSGRLRPEIPLYEFYNLVDKAAGNSDLRLRRQWNHHTREVTVGFKEPKFTGDEMKIRAIYNRVRAHLHAERGFVKPFQD